MSSYARADKCTQWFAEDYPGSRQTPNCCVLHSTESTGWPGYSGGATTPTYTARPNIKAKALTWRAHVPDESSARALRNNPGGVETNTANTVQVELVGTCDPTHRHRWGNLRAGVDYLYWPDAPDWALADLAHFLADQHLRHGTKLQAPTFRAYPASYGNSPVRFTHRQWRNFYGVCGHQHVPENTHGDPGDLDMDRVLELAQALTDPKPEGKRARRNTRVRKARRKGRALVKLLDAAVAHGRTGTVAKVRDNINRQLERLPQQ